MAVRQDYDFNDKAGLLYVITMIKSKVQGWLQNYATKDDLDNVTIEVDSTLSETSQNPLTNQATTQALSLKAPILSPEFTGIPKVPLAIAGSNDLQVANTAFVQAAIQNAVKDLTGLDVVVVDSLPETGEKNTLYYVRKTTPQNQNAFDEYMWVNNAWEFIGSNEIDLSNYVSKDQMVPITTDEIDAMFADW